MPRTVGRPPSLPARVVSELVHHYEAGKSARWMTRYYGISVRTLYKYLRDAGVDLRQPRRIKGPAPRKAQLWRCPYCPGAAEDQAGHPSCLARAEHAA